MGIRLPLVVLGLALGACGGVRIEESESDGHEGGGGAGGTSSVTSVTSATSTTNVTSTASTGQNFDCFFVPCVLAKGVQGADIDIDETDVFVTTGQAGSVVRVSKFGGDLNVVATGDAYAGSIALAGGVVFWAGEGGLFSASKLGGTALTLATPGLPLGEIAVGREDLFFIDRQAFGSIRAVPFVGGEPRVIVPYASMAGDLAVIPGVKNWDELVWGSTDEGPGELRSLLLDGESAPTPLMSGMANPGAVSHGFEGVYIADTFAGTVSRSSTQGANELLVASLGIVGSLAVDDTFLYISDFGEPGESNGKIIRIGRHEALGIEVLADNLNGPTKIAVDAFGVYWLESDPERAIMKLGKDAAF
jgi:hypothetical protein